MYSLMIVDDEPIVLRAISHVVESNYPDIKVVAQTGSGTEAVLLALEKKPDLIFMDIELSGIDGLEAIGEIKKSLPDAVFVVISAYDNFQYAKKSIALEVVDYLLKPVSKDDLLAIINKATAHLDEKRGKTREQMELREKLIKTKPFIEEDLFFSLLYPGIGVHSLLEYPQLLDLNIIWGQAVEVYTKDRHLFANHFQQYKRTVSGHFQGAAEILFSPLIGRTAFILIGYHSIPPKLKAAWDQVYQLFVNDFNLHQTTIILGPIEEKFGGMIASFEKLRKSVQPYTYLPGVYSLEEIPATVEKEFTIPWPIEQQFFESVTSGQRELAKLFLRELFNTVATVFGEDLQSLKDYFQGIIGVLQRVFFENSAGDPGPVFKTNQFWPKVNQANNPDELKFQLQVILDQWIEKMQANRILPQNPEIRVAIEYMNQNYTNDITLTEIATATAVSPSYLSKLFKENYNQTVMDFLERIRIEKALKMLKETNLSIKEISAQVGYRDPNYFSKVFKKVTNHSPTTIRN